MKINSSIEINNNRSVVAELILENIPNPVIGINPDTSIDYVNPALTKLTGFPSEELIGKKTPYPFWPKDVKKSIFNHLQTDIRNGTKGTEELVIKKDGDPLWVEVASIPLIEKNKLVYFIANWVDITARKEAEESLKESEDFLNRIIEETPNPLYIADKNGFVIRMNQALRDLLRVTNEEIIGIYNVLKDKQVKKQGFLPLIKSVFEKGDTIHFEINYYTGEEEQVKLKETAHRIINMIMSSIKDRNGKVKYVIAQHKDITERKKAEEALKIALEQAKKADRLKSAFLANMSHEIRTPMNGILGFTKLLKEPDYSDDKRNLFVDIIHKSGQRLINTINDIIDISRIESGDIQVEIKETYINKQIQDICLLFKPQADNKNVNLQYTIPVNNDELVIQTDPDKFNCILNNLVNNAIKFTDKGRVMVGYEVIPEFIEFYVKDTGIGIPKDKQKAIFNRFVQIEQNYISGHEGSGLGLAITKEYVKILGGTIRVESDVGKGTTFRFTLPNKVVPNQKEAFIKGPAGEISDDMLDKLSILIVENDKSSKELLLEIFKDKCRDVRYAENGVKAVEMCCEIDDIDLVLMDIKLPDMDGYTASSEIRKFNKNVIIIAQTAIAMQGDREKALEAGCNDFISKPIIEEELLGKISQFFSTL